VSRSDRERLRGGTLRAVATEGAPFDIDLLAASLRADAGDLDAFVESLAEKLEAALPGRAEVQRGRRGMFGPKLVRRIAVESSGQRLELIRGEGEVVETKRSRLSGGIVLKSEEIDTESWLRAVGEALAAEAERSQQTRQALERLLIQ
jgi:hypothetical protein